MDQGTSRDGSFRRVHPGEHAVSALSRGKRPIWSDGDGSGLRLGGCAMMCDEIGWKWDGDWREGRMKGCGREKPPKRRSKMEGYQRSLRCSRPSRLGR